MLPKKIVTTKTGSLKRGTKYYKAVMAKSAKESNLKFFGMTYAKIISLLGLGVKIDDGYSTHNWHIPTKYGFVEIYDRIPDDGETYNVKTNRFWHINGNWKAIELVNKLLKLGVRTTTSPRKK